ncbi:MAG: nucleotide sugar dehydrogenase [Acidobacteria bacterium]|nr:nucleotide sugar dehydrogenase [Acidobacteriota bacterium]
MTNRLLRRLRSAEGQVGVIGLGYVGLPLAVAFARAGLGTIGFDVDRGRTAAIGRGESYILDVPAEDILGAVESGALAATADFAGIARVDAIVICVPTPLGKTREPDLSHVTAAVGQVAAHLRAGQLVVLESTTYPGALEEVVRPRLEAGGLRAGADFLLAHSPERIDPGRRGCTARNIPKVVGGVDAESTAAAAALYGPIVDTVVPVSSPSTAEMVKLLENTFRAVNIGLVNEVALLCRKLGVDVWEVIDAAKTKPFGFMPFHPGPGLGGHCIAVDPFYLSWTARRHGLQSRLVEAAGAVNAGMPRHVVDRVAEALRSRSRAVPGSRVHLFGMAYKANVADVRESPAIAVAELLQRGGAAVSYSDPFVPAVCEGSLALQAVPADEALAGGIDCAVILTDHRGVDYAEIARRAPVVVDTRNALAGIEGAHIFRL